MLSYANIVCIHIKYITIYNTIYDVLYLLLVLLFLFVGVFSSLPAT